jgi:HlyD family secretion protein
MKRKTKIIIAVLGIVVLAVIIGITLKMKSSDTVAVQTQQARRGDISHVVSASGYIQPKRSVDISADVAGKVTKIFVEEGDEVALRETLLIIDPAPYEADVARERALLSGYTQELLQAERNLKRAQDISESQKAIGGEPLISDEELETLRTSYEVAKQTVEGARASLRRADEYLGKTTVLAPMAGTVTSLDVEQGEVAVIGTMNNPGTVLLTISDLGEMETEVKVDETDVVNLELGQPVEVTIDAYPDSVFAGAVSEIGNSPIISTRGAVGVQEAVDFLVKVALTNPPVKLKPGLSATAEITTAEKKGTLTVPIQAIVMRNPEGKDGKQESTEEEENPAEEESAESEASVKEEGTEGESVEEERGVFVVQDAAVSFRPIRTGIIGGMEIEITEGISEGDEVVIGSYKVLRTLEDGTKVKIDNMAAKEGTEGEEE